MFRSRLRAHLRKAFLILSVARLDVIRVQIGKEQLLVFIEQTEDVRRLGKADEIVDEQRRLSL